MRVTVDRSVFEQYGTKHVPVSFHDFLIEMETKKSYVLVLDTAISDEYVQSKLNLIDFLVYTNIQLRIVNQPAEPHFSDCVVVVGGEYDDKNKRFAPTEINEYLRTSATIVVENGKNDGCFVRAIMKHFAPSVNFEEQLSNSIVVIDPASGSGARSRIEYFLDIHHKQPKYLRCMVIVDGDKRFPGDNEYGSFKTQQNDGEYFQSNVVSYHVLEKRSMENYMPDEVFNSHRDVFGEPWVDAYLRLTEDQKNYYYIATGFLKDVQKDAKKDDRRRRDRTQVLHEGIQNFYSSVSNTDYLSLLTNPHIGGTFKDEFPKYYNDSQVTKQSLLRRSPVRPNGKSELEEIAEEIIQLL